MMQINLNLRKNPFIFTSLVLLFVAIVFFSILTVVQFFAEKDQRVQRFINLNEGWEYRWDDSSGTGEDKPDFDKLSNGEWKDFKITGKPLVNDGDHRAVWFRINLPEKDNWDNPTLYFELMLSKKVDVFIDNKLIFNDTTYVTPKASSFLLSRDRLIVPLQKDIIGKTLYIKIYSNLEAMGPYRNIYFGEYAEINKQFMRQDIGSIILSFFFIILGFFILPNVIFVNKTDRKSLIYLSCFIISLGMMFIPYSVNINTLFVQNNLIYLVLSGISNVTFIVSFMAFFRQIFFANNPNKFLNTFWNLSIVIFIGILFASIWSLIGGPFTNNQVSNFFILLGIINIIIQIVLVVRNAIKGNIDAKIFTVGFIIYACICSVEVPIFLFTGRVPNMYKWGTLIFIAALVLILGRRFSETHERLVIYSNELVINNEKLNNTLYELQISKNEVDELNRTLEQKVIERTDELRQAMDTLVKTQDQLIQSEKMAALGGLVVGIAHEINTPVGVGVTAASHLEYETNNIAELYNSNKMKRSDLDNYMNICIQSTNMILSNLKRAADLIKSFKKVATDQSSEEKRRFRVEEYINEVLVSLSPELNKTKHNIEVVCPEGLELDSYPGAFSQVISNLIMNSLIHAYNEDEAGVLRFEVQNQEESIVLKYSDNGKGIRKDLLTRIFDPFVTTKRNNGGTGLGLNIVYNIVTQKFMGTIRCESEEGKGTAFIITLPVK